MRTYETLFIINPDLEESEVSKTIDTVQEIITTGGGRILKVDKWGRRQLAYLIQKKHEGYYVLIYFEALPTLIAELNRRYKLAADTILRYLVVQLKKGQIEIEEVLEPGSSADTLTSTSASDSDDEYEKDMYAAEPDEELIASTGG